MVVVRLLSSALMNFKSDQKCLSLPTKLQACSNAQYCVLSRFIKQIFLAGAQENYPQEGLVLIVKAFRDLQVFRRVTQRLLKKGMFSTSHLTV